MSEVRSIGVIGAGRMGAPMAIHWLNAGYQVAVYDPNPVAVSACVSHGASAHATPASVAKASDLTIILVGYPSQIQHCMAGQNGVLEQLRSGGIVVISSTTEPSQVQMLASAVADRGGELLDAPVARAERAAVAADLLWFVGGAKETLEQAREALAICGPDIHHVGGVGAGQVAKAINNMLLWAAVVSNREAFALADAFCVEAAPLRAALLDSSGASWAMAHWDLMSNIPWAHKDLVLTSAMGDQAGLCMPLTGLLRECMKERWAEYGVHLPPPGAAHRQEI